MKNVNCVKLISLKIIENHVLHHHHHHRHHRHQEVDHLHRLRIHLHQNIDVKEVAAHRNVAIVEVGQNIEEDEDILLVRDHHHDIDEEGIHRHLHHLQEVGINDEEVDHIVEGNNSLREKKLFFE
jgi:hypothetical protein